MDKVLKEMEAWLVAILSDRNMATPGALEALPKVADTYLRYSSLLPDKKS